MKGLRVFEWYIVFVISICFLVESESQIRHCETFSETAEHCQGDENDLGLKRDLVEWRTQRKETVMALKDLRDKLDMLCVGANYGKGVGNGAQLIGTVTSIVGSFLELAGCPNFNSVMGIGDLIHHSGSLVEGVSGITESIGSAKYLKDVERILTKDKELSASLGRWLKDWESFGENIIEIFGAEIQSQLFNFLSEFSRILFVTKDFKKTVDKMKGSKYSTYIESENMLDRLLKLTNHIAKNPQIPVQIRMGLNGYHLYSGVSNSYKMLTGTEIAGKISSIPQKYMPPTADSVAIYTFVRSIDIAVKFVSLLDVATVIKEGKSKYSDLLKVIIDIMELELKNMEIIVNKHN